jgi:hypothetical protein
MNAEVVLKWLIEDANKNAERFYNVDVWQRDLNDLISEINSRRNISLPNAIISKYMVDEEEIISILNDKYKNNISNISLILNYIYPEQYLFYRVSILENEIFAGFKFLSEIYDKFQFSFSRIGHNKDSFANYLILNKALFAFASKAWPNIKDPKSIQKRINYFLFDELSFLFLDQNSYNRYWILISGAKNFDSLDNEIDTIWSGRKEMQIGDLVFMYRQNPRKAITEIYKVSGQPYFDAYLGWGGFYTPLRKIASIKDITMVEMKHDPILSKWSFVKVQSQGVIAASIPYSIYNRLLEKIGNDVCIRLGLSAESIGQEENSGTYSSEEEFEDKIIEPLLRHWGFKFRRQHPCYFIIGSQYHTCYVDFIVQDEKGDLTLFEDKLEILNDSQLKRAVLQAKSYSLLLGMKSFVVASPEGFWIYKVERNREILLYNIKSNKLDENEESMRYLIIKIKD